MKAFNEISFSDFTNNIYQNIRRDIDDKKKEYILGVDEEEFVDYLYQKHFVEPLNVLTESEQVFHPTVTKGRITNHGYVSGYQEVDVYHFKVQYNFTGTAALFSVGSSPWIMKSYEIDVNEITNTVSFSFELYGQDPEEFRQLKQQCFSNAFANLGNINKNVQYLSRTLRQGIKILFSRVKEKYQSENSFFEAISLKVNPNTKSVFSVPTVRKRIIAQPTIQQGKQFSSEPVMNSEVYEDVLRVIYEAGKSMEKKPALYQGKDEEGLRDQFLLFLETRYEGTTATGETFNRSGKADILLKYAKDGSNLFVAECKFWHGKSEFLAAISQLFERYLTWRDSKAALLMFVTNKDFSNVIMTIKNEIKNHDCFVQETGAHGETSLSYRFCLPQDRNKDVYFEVIAFHFDK